MFLFPSEKYPEVELLNHMIVLFLSLIFLFISYWSTVDLQCCVSGVQQSNSFKLHTEAHTHTHRPTHVPLVP